MPKVSQTLPVLRLFITEPATTRISGNPLRPGPLGTSPQRSLPPEPAAPGRASSKCATHGVANAILSYKKLIYIQNQLLMSRHKNYTNPRPRSPYLARPHENGGRQIPESSPAPACRPREVGVGRAVRAARKFVMDLLQVPGTADPIPGHPGARGPGWRPPRKPGGSLR